MSLPSTRLSPTAFRALIAAVLFVLLAPATAQVSRDFALDLEATVSASPPHITLSWTASALTTVTAQRLHRRLKGGTTWVLQATLATTDTSYADPTAMPGIEYEYWVQRQFSVYPSVALGYLNAGVNLPLIENRGTLLLVVDDTMTAGLAPELAQLKDDLAGDGWTVQTIPVSRSETPSNVRALIQAAYAADPVNVKAVYLLGHVPVPYSGSINPDGHSNHWGAWPADGYYGDVNGVWTDTSVTTGGASPARTENVPGDGKFDQSSLPSDLELQVGRVDLSGMAQAPASAVSELALLRRYLRKAHDYRQRLGAYASVPRRSMIRDGFGFFGGEAFAASGWAAAFSCVGRNVDQPATNQWFTQATANTYLFGHGNGGGSFTSASSVGTSEEFGRKPSRIVFTQLFGSYHGDWDNPNNFLRAPLAGTATGDSLGLVCSWSGRPYWYYHPAGLGENIGYAARSSMNNSGTNFTPTGFSARGVHEGLMGDPTLRFHMVEPPRNFAATTSAGQVTLRWDASTESSLLGYHVYRAPSPTSAFARLTAAPLGATSYTDATATVGVPHRYLVRTVKLESVPGGTYQNASQGALATVTVSAAPTSAPFGPGSLTAQANTSTQTVLTWADTAANETGFRIERKVNASNNFNTLSNVGANVTTFTDPGPFTHGNVYYYRVVATGAGGDSLPSNEAAVDGSAGFLDTAGPRMKVSRSSGNAAIVVNRFGGGTGPASVTATTSNVSALAGTHYTTATGPVSFSDGENGARIVNVPLTTGSPAQLPRQFNLTLSAPTNSTALAVQAVTRVLVEDPAATAPAGWLQTILGTVTDSSAAVFAEGAIGSAIAGGSVSTTDNGRFVYKSRSGDGVLTAYIDTPLPAQASARFAVMIRGTNSSDDLMASTQVAGSSVGTNLATRAFTDGSVTLTPGTSNNLQLPRWVRLTRSGNTFTSDTSADGATWTALGSTTLSIPASANWGLYHNGDTSGNFQLARFRYVTITNPGVVAAPINFTLTPEAPLQIRSAWDPVGGATGYRLERRARQGTYAPLQTLAAGNVTFTDTDVLPGVIYEYRVQAYDSTINSAWTTFFTTAPGTANPYNLWLKTHGLPMDGSGNGAPTATPARDDIPNAIKYALGLTPTIPSYFGRVSSSSISESGERYLTLSYIRPDPAPAGVLYKVLVGSDLAGWNSAQALEISSAPSINLRTITTRDTVPISAATPQRFIRLEVTVP